jgi:hypothetical protein
MREHDSAEHRVQLTAGRHGLRLVRNRYRVAAGSRLYCLRAIWNAYYVVSRLPEGGLGLVRAQTGRQVTASWLTLTEIEQVLAAWNEPAPRAWGEPFSEGSDVPYSSYHPLGRPPSPRDPRGTQRQKSGGYAIVRPPAGIIILPQP